jgi:transcriptional regulator MraZ
MLRGNHPAKVDKKGRLRVPAAFLRPLRDLGQEFYITSEGGYFAKIYPMTVWLEIEGRIARISSHNSAKQKFLTWTGYYGQVVGLDKQGRLLVPRVLREAARIADEVCVLGFLNHLEVWNNERFVEYLRTNPITLRDFRDLEGLDI